MTDATVSADPPPADFGVPSLEGLHDTVAVPPAGAPFGRQLRAYVGPALLIAVGYMDPGNWGTDLSAGAQFKYGLLWVVALASFMAVFMQVLSARLGVVTGRDLAQAMRDWYPAWTRWPNWIAAEIAIAACDLAEVLGAAVALNLLFHIPILWAVLITAADVFLLLALQRFGMRTIEAVVAVLVLTIAVCYGIEVLWLPQTRPSVVEMGTALAHPSLGGGMMFTAIGIVGATVMPHNLYLHSALVQTRRTGSDAASVARGVRFNQIDSVVALSLAFLINAAILILAAVTFFGHKGITVDGRYVAFSDDTDWLREAYYTLTPLLHNQKAAAILFAVALLAAGQSSTITGTLAGQVVMEGFMHWHITPWVRRLSTRMVAIVPAVAVIGWKGDGSITGLLVLSQVVLAIQLPLAMFPLLHLTSSGKRMGVWRSGPVLLAIGWTSAVLITAMDLWGLPESLRAAWAVIRG